MVTTDISLLGSWVQHKHLEDSSLGSYREGFEKDPCRMLVLEDFLVEPMAERLSAFLEKQAVFETQRGLYSEPDREVSEDEWNSSPPSDRLFRFSKLVGILPEYRLDQNAMTYIRFRAALGDPSFCAFFEQISDLELKSEEDFGCHSMQFGDFLLPHDDDSRGRSVAIVLYLSRGWEPDFGGALRMVDERGDSTTTVARYNSIVMFDVAAGTTHEVEAITKQAGERRRLTIGGWYHKP